jgi:beta-fructofuranosidase
MSLSLSDRWIWDFWLAKDGPDFHIYYLQAPRSVGDPGERHWHATIGHAVSSDLQQWDILPDAIVPSTEDGNWDDYTTWTGSVIRHAGLWYMFYTGGNRGEKGLIQRVGMAISKNLINWKKYDANPVIISEPSRYEQLDLDLWHDQAWRDPWVFEDSRGEGFYAFITARVNFGPPDGRGVIALAKSSDLLGWEVLDPVTSPGDFGHLEIPQVIQVGGLWYLLFSTSAEVYSKDRIQRSGSTPVTGTHYLVSEDPMGPYRYLTDEFLVGDPTGSRYGGKLVAIAKDQWVLLTMRHFDERGRFIGELDDPVPVGFKSDGIIQLDRI